jgi:hypothetical protein
MFAYDLGTDLILVKLSPYYGMNIKTQKCLGFKSMTSLPGREYRNSIVGILRM